jgi:molybdate transport system substrate-binding protein
MKNKVFVIVWVLWLLIFVPTTAVLAGEELVVSAAASLRNVMEAAGRLFESNNPGAKICFNFASSGVLAQQILNGAPVDVFFSADIKDFDRFSRQPDVLVPGFPREFMRNRLCFVVASHVKNSIASLEDIAKPEWQKIAIGSSATVPAGRYAEQALKAMALYDVLQARFIFCENVRQVH